MENNLEDLNVTELQEEVEKHPQKQQKGIKKKATEQKADLKKKLRILKTQKAVVLDNKDRKALKSIRTSIKKLKRRTRRSASIAGGIS